MEVVDESGDAFVVWGVGWMEWVCDAGGKVRKRGGRGQSF
jgi:hypothetical protein